MQSVENIEQLSPNVIDIDRCGYYWGYFTIGLFVVALSATNLTIISPHSFCCYCCCCCCCCCFRCHSSCWWFCYCWYCWCWWVVAAVVIAVVVVVVIVLVTVVCDGVGSYLVLLLMVVLVLVLVLVLCSLFGVGMVVCWCSKGHKH